MCSALEESTPRTWFPLKNLFESSCTARPTPYPLPRVVLHGEPVDRAAAARMDLALDEREDARIVRRLV